MHTMRMYLSEPAMRPPHTQWHLYVSVLVRGIALQVPRWQGQCPVIPSWHNPNTRHTRGAGGHLGLSDLHCRCLKHAALMSAERAWYAEP